MKKPNRFIFQRWKKHLALGILSTLLTAIPVQAAEKLYFTYGPLKLSLSVASLETFAKEGKINPDLNFYLKRVSPEKQAKFLRQPGEYGFKKETWQLTDQGRDRQFHVDVYKPQKWLQGKTPVIIISHGLSSSPEDMSAMAEHLTSYGYVGALPQHPSSDAQHTQAFRKGYAREVFEVNEFINRPKDISYVIDELERRNQSQFEGRLNLESVGVGGHSFGGYTALAVAGAEIDFDYLEQDCTRQFGGLDTSLLLPVRYLASLGVSVNSALEQKWLLPKFKAKALKLEVEYHRQG